MKFSEYAESIMDDETTKTIEKKYIGINDFQLCYVMNEYATRILGLYFSSDSFRKTVDNYKRLKLRNGDMEQDGFEFGMSIFLSANHFASAFLDANCNVDEDGLLFMKFDDEEEEKE